MQKKDEIVDLYSARECLEIEELDKDKIIKDYLLEEEIIAIRVLEDIDRILIEWNITIQKEEG